MSSIGAAMATAVGACALPRDREMAAVDLELGSRRRQRDLSFEDGDLRLPLVFVHADVELGAFQPGVRERSLEAQPARVAADDVDEPAQQLDQRAVAGRGLR